MSFHVTDLLRLFVMIYVHNQCYVILHVLVSPHHQHATNAQVMYVDVMPSYRLFHPMSMMDTVFAFG